MRLIRPVFPAEMVFFSNILGGFNLIFTWDKMGRIKTGSISDVTGVSSPIVIFIEILTVSHCFNVFLAELFRILLK